MLTVMVVLLVAATVCVVAEAMGKCPPWVSKVFMLVILMLMILPVGTR